jgi:anhydro-N-acetylmuramic acid kinase
MATDLNIGLISGTDYFNETWLADRLQRVDATSAWGIDPDWVEAVAFAWMARQRIRGEPSNVPAVTGARAEVRLGGVYLPPVR